MTSFVPWNGKLPQPPTTGSDEKKKEDEMKDKANDQPDDIDSEDDDGDYKTYLADVFGERKEEDSIDIPGNDTESVALEAGVDDEGAMELAIEGTKKYLADHPDASAEDIVEIVTNQQMASVLKFHDQIHILARAAITPQFFKEKQIEKYGQAMEAIINGNKKIERQLIASLELLCIEKPNNFVVMIKQCYDEDVIQEETILEWANETGRSEYTLVDEETRAALRRNAEPVIVWLQDDEDGNDGDCD